jgi:ABC-type sugar transport system permease subunit
MAHTQLQTDPRQAGETRQKRSKRANRDAVLAWTILTPMLLYYTVFAIVPVAANLGLSFLRWNGITQWVWAGLENYIHLLTDPYYLQVYANTAFFAVVSVLIQIPLGLLVAILVNQKIRGMGIYRSLWYVPVVTSAAIMSQVLVIFMAPYGGVLNSILKGFGINQIIWLVNVDALRAVILGFTVWKGVGSIMVLYLAALQGIPNELYEAAAVDGANSVQRFRYITVPMLRNMTTFVVITGIIGGFQIFEPVLLISKGGPYNQTNVVLNQIYNDAFKNMDFGLATASSTLLALALLIGSIITTRMSRQSEGSS